MATAKNGYCALKNIGGSLPVENVQWLAASVEESKLPERYVRPEISAEHVLNNEEDGEIPVIDLSRLLHVHHKEEEIMKLGLACQEWGFFQIINHGVPEEVIERMKCEIQGFFRLPLEEKKTYAQQPGSLEGYGQAFVVSDEQKLDWGDMYFLATQPLFARNVELWPSNPPAFRAALDQYSVELKRVSSILVKTMARCLGVEALTDMFIDGLQSMRMNYYPACRQANKVLGLSPHSDAVGLTLLLQVNQVQGLQIKKNGAWMPIKPLTSAFIVNIGDILEILSNGRYKSIEHRAVINPDNERISIAAFHGPRLDVPIGPIQELVGESEELYKTISSLDYMRLITSSKLEGKNILEQMKLKK
ncbi:(S)-norcoclaurine synthase protein [Dioscorea alata]|uniref:(S)-norcoclaurine synthase protein n=1 Tax=Dioscorea alata TaxID=55571 RepID=A0ACB7UG50_DIOAL|nr:(S)-norcoclaurine synthase protein [Dioscorea alata]